MKVILFTLLLCFIALPTTTLGHTYLSWISIDDTPQPEGDCVRPHPPTARENPIPLVTAEDMTCGWLPYAAEAANRKCPVEAGSTVGLQWHHTSNTADDDILAPTHLGPCLVYLAKSETGEGPVWFKIFEDGYDESTQKWCVDKLLANKGLLTVTLPTDIAPGNYLLRGEIFALHGANVINGVQPYVGCAELTVSSSGSAEPKGVSIPGVYTSSDAGLFISIYQPFAPYVIPGPPIYEEDTSPASPTARPTTKPSSAPTSSPTSAPTSSPTSAPSDTYSEDVEPTDVPTAAPVDEEQHNDDESPTSVPISSSSSPVRVQLYPSSSEYWIATAVRSEPSTTSIELKDSGAVITWKKMQTTTWGYWVFSTTTPLVLPISLRLKAATGQHLVLKHVFSSWAATSFIDTGKTFPTVVPSPVSTRHPAIKLQMHEGSSEWWFAVAFSQTLQIVSAVDVKDSDTITDWQPLIYMSWDFWLYNTQGQALVAPLTFRLSSDSGSVVEIEIPSIYPYTDFDTTIQFDE